MDLDADAVRHGRQAVVPEQGGLLPAAGRHLRLGPGGLDEDTGAVLGDAFILDTRLWEWSRAPKRVETAFGARAGHSLVCVRDGDARMLLAFGGRGADGLTERADLAKVVVDERTFKACAVPPRTSAVF